MLLNTLGATSLETWVTGLQLTTIGRPSWTAIIILASAMIMPHTPHRRGSPDRRVVGRARASVVARALAGAGNCSGHLTGLRRCP